MKLIYTTTKICELANKRLDYLKSLFVEFISTEIRTLKQKSVFHKLKFSHKIKLISKHFDVNRKIMIVVDRGNVEEMLKCTTVPF